ncbi:myosin-2 essential light chain, partial [Clonorchis sinensis]
IHGFSEARDVFSLFDSVGDEKILVKDIGEVVRALGLNPTESDIRKFNNRSDPGERITFEMFVPIYQALAKEQKDINPEEFIEGFRVFDKESNGFISAAELRHLLTALGERLREDEVDQLLAGMENSQGLVPYEVLWVKYARVNRIVTDVQGFKTSTNFTRRLSMRFGNWPSPLDYEAACVRDKILVEDKRLADESDYQGLFCQKPNALPIGTFANCVQVLIRIVGSQTKLMFQKDESYVSAMWIKIFQPFCGVINVCLWSLDGKLRTARSFPPPPYRMFDCIVTNSPPIKTILPTTKFSQSNKTNELPPAFYRHVLDVAPVQSAIQKSLLRNVVRPDNWVTSPLRVTATIINIF